MDKNAKIYVAGNTGLVGSAITRKLISEGYTNLVFTPFPEYDLRNQEVVKNFFEKEKPEYVFLAAAKVGGINANNIYKADFIYDNLMIESNIIHQAHLCKVKKLLFLGSSCIYPKNCPQPIKEEYLLTGTLEPTNEPYALAKIAGLKMCDYYRFQYGDDFISAMPTNLYGPNDNYNLETSHVLPAMLRKIYLAKCLEEGNIGKIRDDLTTKKFTTNEVNIESYDDDKVLSLLRHFGINKNESGKIILSLWGSGKPRREFLYVDDLADALLFLMIKYSDYGHVNVGTGVDIEIKQLAEMIKKEVGFNGDLCWDVSKPDGTKRKLLNVTKLINIGWKNENSLYEGLCKTINLYLR